MTVVRRFRALPLGLLTVLALVLIGALFPAASVHDAVTLERVPQVSLQRPMSYVLMAPMSNVLDTMTLLSVRQHIATLITLLLTYAMWWWLRGRGVGSGMTTRRRAIRIVAQIGAALVGLIAVYAAMAVMPRPMASLEIAPNLLAIDFHSHTRYSHDGRRDWGPEDVRSWHRDAGYHVAYVTDHRTFEGARDGWANNPAQAGQGTTLLPGIEVVWRGEHVNVLDADRFYTGIFTATLRDIDEEALALASSIPGSEPVLIETLPGDLSQMRPARGSGTPGVRAIEIVDGAPRGLGQTRREHARIVQLADSFDLALVAGSNHHGWGRTATAWTIMSVPQWRAATPEALSKVIGMQLRSGGRESTRVIARYVADTESGLSLPLTLPLVIWGMIRTLTGDERIVWAMWALAIHLLWRLRRMRRDALATSAP